MFNPSQVSGLKWNITQLTPFRYFHISSSQKFCFKNLTFLGYHDDISFFFFKEDTIARPIFPTGVWTGGTIWLPGMHTSLSFSLGPSLTSISNRCTLQYTATMEPLSSTKTWELYNLLSSAGPCWFCTGEKKKWCLLLVDRQHNPLPVWVTSFFDSCFMHWEKRFFLVAKNKSQRKRNRCSCRLHNL